MKNNNRCSRLQLCALAIAGFLYSFAAQANLIINGGFEEPTFVDNGSHYVHLYGTDLTGWAGWTSFPTYRSPVLFNALYNPVSEGSQAVQIEVGGDWISQSFATVIGQSYTVAFDLSAYSVYGGPSLGPCPCSSILGVTVGSFSATFGGSSAGYVTNAMQFTADSSVTALTFLNLGVLGVEGNYPQIDNISVTGPAPVPVPAAFWLFGSGLLGLIGAARRKKAQSM